MKRWRVRRKITYYFDPDGNNAFGLRWCVDSPAGVYWGNYETHAEALVYADKQARTRQVVLPRPQLNKNGRVEFDFTEWSGLDYWPELPDSATYDRRTGPNIPAFGANVPIPRERWKPLALALLALAEQEESCRE